MKIKYTTSDQQTTTVLKFKQVTQYKTESTFTIHTQCVVKVNSLIQGVGTVVKYYGDIDNPKWAYFYSAKKALKDTNITKEVKSVLWKQLIQKMK